MWAPWRLLGFALGLRLALGERARPPGDLGLDVDRRAGIAGIASGNDGGRLRLVRRPGRVHGAAGDVGTAVGTRYAEQHHEAAHVGEFLDRYRRHQRNPAVPDHLREEALREILSQVDVDGPEIVAVHPAPNENAWLLGLVAVREQKLTAQREVGLVGARGFEPVGPTPRIVLPEAIWAALRGVA